MNIRDFTAEELYDSLLPPAFIEKMKTTYSPSENVFKIFTDTSSIVLITQEINQHKNGLLDFLKCLHDKMDKATRKQLTQMVQKQLPSHLSAFIVARSNQLQHNIEDYIVKKTIPQVKNNALEVTAQNFPNILKENKVVILHVWSEWHIPCKAMNPTINELIAVYKRQVFIGKVDINKNADLISQYKVEGIPTLLFFQYGKLRQKLVGVQLIKRVKTLLDGLLSSV